MASTTLNQAAITAIAKTQLPNSGGDSMIIAVQKTDIDKVNATVDALSSKLYRLERIVHLAAFATEARRVLSAVEELEGQVPSFKETIQDCIVGRNEWCEFEDVGAEVMRQVANEISDVANELFKGTNTFRILSHSKALTA